MGTKKLAVVPNADDIPVRGEEETTAAGSAEPPIDDPEPTLTLRAGVVRDFGAALQLHRVGYMSHSAFREWELWADRHRGEA